MNRGTEDWADLYDCLLQAYGPQNWWPGRDNLFEVVVGAILTQRTTWCNASRAVAALRPALLSIRGIGAETADAILVYAAGCPSFFLVPLPLLDGGGWVGVCVQQYHFSS